VSSVQRCSHAAQIRTAIPEQQYQSLTARIVPHWNPCGDSQVYIRIIWPTSDTNDAASQYERSFLPHRLGNWEAPDTSKLAQERFGTLPARTGKTKTIVGENGHLNPGFKKAGVAAFAHTQEKQRPVYAKSKPRWPTVSTCVQEQLYLLLIGASASDESRPALQKNVSWTWAPRSTMGYKGIQTEYLPITTVPVKTYMTDGCKDFNFLH
jgi:hypothetical protein